MGCYKKPCDSNCPDCPVAGTTKQLIGCTNQIYTLLQQSLSAAGTSYKTTTW